MTEYIAPLLILAFIVGMGMVVAGVTGWRPRRPRWRAGYVWIGPADAPFPKHAKRYDLFLRGETWYWRTKRGWEAV